MPRINCLKDTIKSGSSTFPIFIGFLPAEEILSIAEAPSFGKSTTHQAIATNVLTPPIKEWQRPLDSGRVSRIASVFDDSGKLMPNPVLLAVNMLGQQPIQAKQQVAQGGIPTNVWEIDVTAPPPGQEKPLWILDGQHRINGLAGSNQSKNAVPLVLLLNEGVQSYSGALLAELFAQVTTSAAQLDPLHDEWLTYAFQLGDYAISKPDSQEHQDAMETVAHLCIKPNLSDGSPNPFCNEVQFNNNLTVRGSAGGFAYTCTDLKDLIRTWYFAASASQPRLIPSDLANQIGLAYVALQKSVAAPLDESVFFGSPSEFGQRIMQDAFLAGVFALLLKSPPPSDWVPTLQSLKFPTTDWKFRSWVRTLSGRASSLSRKVAIGVFRDIFARKALPPNGAATSDVVEFLRGNDLKFRVEASSLTPKGRPAKAGKACIDLQTGAVRNLTLSSQTHLRVVQPTQNIGRLTVHDGKSAPGRQVTYPELMRGGMVLDPLRHSKPLDLVFEIELYGGNSNTVDLQVTW